MSPILPGRFSERQSVASPGPWPFGPAVRAEAPAVPRPARVGLLGPSMAEWMAGNGLE